MHNEIERKFLLKELPYFVTDTPVLYSRYFLYVKNGVEIRVQSKDKIYELERKEKNGNLSRSTQKIIISEDEFNFFKSLTTKSLVRKSYLIIDIPNASIKVYLGDYIGLIRAEVEFASEEGADNFNVPNWFGKEITNTPLGKDKELSNLSKSEFVQLLEKYK